MRSSSSSLLRRKPSAVCVAEMGSWMWVCRVCQAWLGIKGCLSPYQQEFHLPSTNHKFRGLSIRNQLLVTRRFVKPPANIQWWITGVDLEMIIPGCRPTCAHNAAVSHDPFMLTYECQDWHTPTVIQYSEHNYTYIHCVCASHLVIYHNHPQSS